MTPQELWELDLVQINGHVVTAEAARTMSYADLTQLNRYPGTPHANRETLPSCHLCSQEVKPGEDYCWSCLGEYYPKEAELTYWIFGGAGPIGSHAGQIDSGFVKPISYDPLVFTWNAIKAATVTGLQVSSENGTFHKTFAPIVVATGDSIQWTINAFI